MLDTLAEVSSLLCGRPNALEVDDEFNIGDVDDENNVNSIEKTVDNVLNTITGEAERLRNGTNETSEVYGPASPTGRNTSNYKTQEEKSKSVGSNLSNQPETIHWSAYQLKEIMEFQE